MKQRQKLGITACHLKGGIDWTKIELGVLDDVVIAALSGISEDAVRKERRKQKIRKYDPLAIRWDCSGLGKVPDGDIAFLLNKPEQKVAVERRKRSILPYARKIDWDNIGLGIMPDKKLASMIGSHRAEVGAERRKRNIPAYKHRLDIDWDSLPLGQVPDSAIATLVGLKSCDRIRRERRGRGIPAYGRLAGFDAARIPFGTKPDAEIAEEYGLTKWQVANTREKLGIDSYNARLNAKHSFWDQVDLGRKPDKQIAKEMGVCVSTVSSARNARKIPKFSGGVLTQEGLACDSLCEARYDAWLHWQNIPHQHQVEVPGLTYIADFFCQGQYVEILGMIDYPRYAEKIKRKRRAYKKARLKVLWLEPKDVDALYKECPLDIACIPERKCKNCGEFAKYEHFCEKCFNKTYKDPELIKITNRQAECQSCGDAFGWNMKAAERTYCSKRCVYDSTRGKPRGWRKKALAEASTTE